MTTDKATDIQDLRRLAGGAWKTLAILFGRPDAIIRKGFISLADHRVISDWLRHFEHLVRRILLVLALDIFVPEPKPAAPRPQSTRRRIFRRMSAFKVLLGRPCLRRRAGLARKQKAVRCAADTPVRSAAVGRRFEALRHALAHIDASALRLARAIRRRVHAPVRKYFVRLKPWRVHTWRATLPSLTFAPDILKAEKHLPEVFVEPG